MGDVEFGWTRGSAPLPAIGTAGVDDRRSSFALSRRERRLSGIVTAVVKVSRISRHDYFFRGELESVAEVDRGCRTVVRDGAGRLDSSWQSQLCFNVTTVSYIVFHEDEAQARREEEEEDEGLPTDG